MKKFTLIISLSMLMFALCSCGSKQQEEEIPPYGALIALDFEYQALDDNFDEPWEENNDNYMLNFDSFMSMQMALNSDKIKLMYCPLVVAEYAQKLNPEYCILSDFGIIDGFEMGLLPENEELRDSINDVLAQMKEDGSLQALEDEYINGEGTFVVSDPVEGRETLKVVVTGDYAPIDYIAPDGTPCGYNAALMQAIGDKLGYNIEFVCVDSSQRLTALTTGKADVIFLIQVQDADNPSNEITNPNLS